MGIFQACISNEINKSDLIIESKKNLDEQKINNNGINEIENILEEQINLLKNLEEIYMKNNKNYETIVFQVEKNLKPENGLYKNKNIKEIFDDIFCREKTELNDSGEIEYLGKNESMEILHYKLDTNETEFYNFEKKSLIQGLSIAYQNHFPIIISPDMIWLLILQGYSRYMEKYAEVDREKYVNFKGQKTLYINRSNLQLAFATEKDWAGIMDECVEKISKHVGKETITNLQSNFSTTNDTTLVVSQTSIMSAMKQYFKYEVLFAGCGVSYIILEGSSDDWKKIKSKLNYLSKFSLDWWTNHLIPIIDNIIKTKEFYDVHKNINNELIEFRKGMIKVKDGYDMYRPAILNGWIIKFIPKLDEEKPKLYEELHEKDIPDQIISCPLKIIEIVESIGKKFKIVYSCDLTSGFFGMIQDKKTLAIKPVIGYAIAVDKKEKSELTEKDREEIKEHYGTYV